MLYGWADEPVVIPGSFESPCLGGSNLKESCLVFMGPADAGELESRFEKLDIKESTK